MRKNNQDRNQNSEENLKDWPPVEGRYEVGNKKSRVAVCTNYSIDEIEIDPQKVAIWGKCVTENIGIEKIIQNVVSNLNLRYLVLCGRVSKGHFVSQAIESLIKKGIDEKKKIIGAKGNMPFLRNLNKKIVGRFRKQVTPVNIVGETDSEKIGKVINKLLKMKPEEFKAEEIKIKKVEEITANPCPEWIPDPNGYFLISINKKGNKIVVEHYSREKELKNKIVGDKAEKILKTIANLELIGDFEQTQEHAMYLGEELQKAEIALHNNLEYVQDSPLKIGEEKPEGEKGRDEYDFYD